MKPNVILTYISWTTSLRHWIYQFHSRYGVYYNRNQTTVVIFIVIVKAVLLDGLPKILRGQ